jgi:hypothetical protein
MEAWSFSSSARTVRPRGAGTTNTPCSFPIKQLEQMAAANHVPTGRKFSDQELNATRERIRELHDRWTVVPSGANLELTFT